MSEELFKQLDGIAEEIQNPKIAVRQLNELLIGKYSLSYEWFTIHLHKIYPNRIFTHVHIHSILNVNGDVIWRIIHYIKNDMIKEKKK